MFLSVTSFIIGHFFNLLALLELSRVCLKSHDMTHVFLCTVCIYSNWFVSTVLTCFEMSITSITSTTMVQFSICLHFWNWLSSLCICLNSHNITHLSTYTICIYFNWFVLTVMTCFEMFIQDTMLTCQCKSNYSVISTTKSSHKEILQCKALNYNKV